jgi:Zn-dependent protease
MRQTVRLGRIAGIPIGVHWSVLVITVLLWQSLAIVILPATAPDRSTSVYWLTALVASVLFLASLLAHELSHALVALHYRMRVQRVTLWLLGGVAELGGVPPSPRADLLVALAGPLTSLGCAGLFTGIAVAVKAVAPSSITVAAFGWLAAVNAVLAIFNLLPGAPLDGGRVLRALLWWRRKDRSSAQLTAARAGMILGGLMIVLGVFEVLATGNFRGLWLALVGWFLVSAAAAERVDARVGDLLSQVPVEAVMTVNPVCGYAEQTVESFLQTVVGQHTHRRYPVVTFDGAVVGVVSLSGLAGVPAIERSVVRLGRATTPIGRVPVIRPDQRIPEVSARVPPPGAGLALVVDGGRLRGVLSGGDLARTLELAALGIQPARLPEP